MANPVDVKWFSSDMAGAPTLSGEVGKTIGVLDACLIDGFGDITLDSVSVSSSIATATYSAGHGFLDHSVILIAGAGDSYVNGDKRITYVSSTQFTFDATGAGDGSVSGTITAKVSPVGWTKDYSGTNKAAYARSDVTATGALLRIDNSGTGSATYIRVRGYESMTDVDTGSGEFPTDAQVSGGHYWAQSSTASSTTREWRLAADGLSLVLWVNHSGTATAASVNYFGDLESEKASDAYCAMLTGGVTTSVASMSGLVGTSANNKFMPKSYTQVGTSTEGIFKGHVLNSSGMGYAGSAYPSALGSQVYITKPEIWESATVFRGTIPGVYAPIHAASGITDGDSTTSITGLENRVIQFWRAQASYCVAVDLTGPWR